MADWYQSALLVAADNNEPEAILTTLQKWQEHSRPCHFLLYINPL